MPPSPLGLQQNVCVRVYKLSTPPALIAFVASHFQTRHYILGLQPRDMVFMLVDRIIDLFFSLKKDEFPVEGKGVFLTINMATVKSVVNQQ